MKKNTCCFCGRTGNSEYGAVNEDNKKYLCMDCVVELYQAMEDEIKQYDMDKSVKEEE